MLAQKWQLVALTNIGPKLVCQDCMVHYWANVGPIYGVELVQCWYTIIGPRLVCQATVMQWLSTQRRINNVVGGGGAYNDKQELHNRITYQKTIDRSSSPEQTKNDI